MPAEWTDAEIEQLSAYIDEQLEESDRTALEARLANNADLRQELAVMRQTVALLRDLPTIRAPRAFTLTPDMVGQTAVPAAALADSIRVLPTQRPRQAQRTWWIPAASAAGVVLLAGAFLLTQTQNSGTQAPSVGAVQQGVAVAVTSTVVLDGSAFNTVVLDSVTQSVPRGVPSVAPSEIEQSNDTAESAINAGESPADDGGTDEGVARNTLDSLPSEQGQLQIPVTMTQGVMSAPAMQPVIAQTEQEPRFMPSPTVEMLEAMIIPLASSTPPPTASLDSDLAQQSGESATANTGSGGGNPEQEMIAGMDGLNLNPNAPGFTVATVSPIQGTVIAQYNQPLSDQTLVLTPEPASSVMSESQLDKTVNEPIWIRWFNVLSEWVQNLLRE